MNITFVKRAAALCLTAVLAFGMLAGCGGESGDAVPVQTVASIVGHGNVGFNNRFAGVVVAGNTAEIKLDSNMTVAELKVEVGQSVNKGDVLFTYDTEAMQLSIEQTELEIESMQNTIETSQRQIADLEKQAEDASSSDKLSYTLEIQSLQMQIKETEYNISVKQAELKRQNTALLDTSVKSPVSGNVTAINEKDSTDNYGNPLPYIVVSETANLRIKGTLNEMNRESIYEGAPVTVISRTDDTARWTGTVSAIDYDSVIKNNNNMYYDGGSSDEMTSSSKYPFYVTLEENDGLFLGQHVYVQVGEDADESTAVSLVLPAYLINDPDGKAWVWADNGKGKLEKRSVSLGDYVPESDSYVILSGLTTDDSITFNDESYKEGMKVTVMDGSAFSGGAMEFEDVPMDGAFYPEEGFAEGDDFTFEGDAPMTEDIPMTEDVPMTDEAPVQDGMAPDAEFTDAAQPEG